MVLLTVVSWDYNFRDQCLSFPFARLGFIDITRADLVIIDWIITCHESGTKADTVIHLTQFHCYNTSPFRNRHCLDKWALTQPVGCRWECIRASCTSLQNSHFFPDTQWKNKSFGQNLAPFFFPACTCWIIVRISRMFCLFTYKNGHRDGEREDREKPQRHDFFLT